MERVCFLYELRPGAEAEYEERHRAVWPEMLALLDEAGVSDYSIYRRGTTLFCVMTASPDFATASARLARSEVQARWTASLRHLFARITEDDGTPLFASEVFRHAADRPGEEL